MAYNKDQWIESFEDRLTILRPHLTLRVLVTMALSAWNQHGRADEDPVKAANAWHAANTPAPAAPPDARPARKKA